MRDATRAEPDTHASSGRVDLSPGRGSDDIHQAFAGADLSRAQNKNDNQASGGAAELSPDQRTADAQRNRVGAELSRAHPLADTQTAHGAAELSPGQALLDTHKRYAGADIEPDDALLMILADMLDDLERVRIATDNRIRSLSQIKGRDNSPETRSLGELQEGIAALEKQATKRLEQSMRMRHRLGPWVKRTVGVGEKQGARLLAAIGDPADRPNPAKLWQYAGHGDPDRSRRRKGHKVEYSPQAKMRVHLVAEAAVKAGVRKLDGCDDSDGYDLSGRMAISPLGEVYLREREKWADRDTSDGHRHNHALRVVGKEMLLDLWREARRLRGDQKVIDTQVQRVPA